LPRGLAIVATRGAEKQIEGIKRAQEARAIRDLDHAREVRNQLEQLSGVQVAMKTSENGKLFGSVSADDIVSAIEAAGGPKLDKRIVVLPKGLVKKTGNYQVELKLHADVLGKVNFSVVAA
ncbi:TPA: 50S ribosomal protein L9, partial [Corynebacterium striatum]|nr:50S ribosomal protein L9 [Corynebacterium striatum]